MYGLVFFKCKVDFYCKANFTTLGYLLLMIIKIWSLKILFVHNFIAIRILRTLCLPLIKYRGKQTRIRQRYHPSPQNQGNVVCSIFHQNVKHCFIKGLKVRAFHIFSHNFTQAQDHVCSEETQDLRAVKIVKMG